jgi:hypothetical protein
VHLEGERLKERVWDPAGVREDGERIALERSISEDITDHVAEFKHPPLPGSGFDVVTSPELGSRRPPPRVEVKVRA